MATLWLTYAWKDNENHDVDFIAQELRAAGITVKLDRWVLRAGTRLWDQISTEITDSNRTDAWLWYATETSLGSEPCKEEFAYALQRALDRRGEQFPVIALFPGSVDKNLIPMAIRVRLYVSSTDSDWKERIVAAVEHRTPSIPSHDIQPYFLQVHSIGGPAHGSRRFAIEVRPRAGTWSPFFAAVPLAEQSHVKVSFLRSPSGLIPTHGVLNLTQRGESQDGKWWMESAVDEATPSQSYFVFCDQLPTVLCFGIRDRPPQFQISLA